MLMAIIVNGQTKALLLCLLPVDRALSVALLICTQLFLQALGQGRLLGIATFGTFTFTRGVIVAIRS